MKRKSSIEALIKRCKDDFSKLKTDYEKSLSEKKISEELKIDIKNIFENLRSCLDYIAHDIVESQCPSANPKKKLYFPIRSSRADFDSCIKTSYPDLDTNNTPLHDYLESIQPYNKQWLGDFNKLNNNNKHQDLAEQSKSEIKRVTVTGQGGGSVSWGPGVKFGGGVSVMGVPIDPNTQLPVPNKTVETKIINWVDFRFKETGQSVLPFIDESINQVESIFSEVDSKI